jgi:hypothetical protein
LIDATGHQGDVPIHHLLQETSLSQPKQMALKMVLKMVLRGGKGVERRNNNLLHLSTKMGPALQKRLQV